MKDGSLHALHVLHGVKISCFMLLPKARAARLAYIHHEAELSIIKPAFCGFREQSVTPIKQIN